MLQRLTSFCDAASMNPVQLHVPLYFLRNSLSFLITEVIRNDYKVRSASSVSPIITVGDIDVELVDELALKAVAQSATDLLARMTSEEATRRLIWPIFTRSTPTPGLKLVLLDRISASQGFSGSRV